MITTKRDVSFILSSDIEKKDYKILFEINPKGCLSIVDLIGRVSHISYNDLHIKICGMIENMIGILITKEERKRIVKLVEKKYKIKHNRFNKNGFFSIIQHLVDVKYDTTPFEKGVRFVDLQTRNIRRPKSATHLKGCAYNYEATVALMKKYGTKDGVYNLKNISQVEKFTEEEFNTLPHFYKQAYHREYIKIDQPINVSLCVTKEFFDFFQKLYFDDELHNDLFLGHSESLISVENIKFE